MNIFMKEFLKPVARRMGTAAATFLLAAGVAQDTATAIGAGLTAAALLAFDLILSHRDRA